MKYNNEDKPSSSNHIAKQNINKDENCKNSCNEEKVSGICKDEFSEETDLSKSAKAYNGAVDDKLQEEASSKESFEKKLLYPVIFLVGMSVILMEIGLTRIFSIALWHHFAFLSVAIALFGLGVSGVFLTVYSGILKKNFYKSLFNFTVLLSLSNLFAFFIFTRLHLDVNNIGQPLNLVKFVLFYLVLSLPFFFGGCVMSSIISRKSNLVQKLYFFDLMGAGLGCLVVVFLISKLGGPGIMVLSSVLSALAALVSSFGFQGAGKRKTSFGVLAYILVLFIIMGFSGFIFTIPLPSNKALNYYVNEHNSEILFSAWNSFSRVDAFTPVPKYTWGLSPKYTGEIPDQIGITIDGDGFTSIVNFDGDWDKIDFPQYTLGSLVHYLNGEGSALIIGAGGGIDVLSARKYGAKKIDAVEINPAITYLAEEKFKEYSGGLFHTPGINIITAEGRNFIARSNDKYNLVYLPLVDSWAASYSGAYSLSENYLYTVEAFKSYYDLLEEGGFVSISRWEYTPDSPHQSYRLCALAAKAAESDLRGNVVVTNIDRLSNFIWKKGAFSEEELENIRAFCDAGEFEIQYMPGMENPFALLLNPDTGDSFQKAYPWDISPVTDDRPFFYLIDRWKNILIYLDNTIKRKTPFPMVFTIVLVILGLSILFSAVFILLPLKYKGIGSFKGKKPALYLAYFTLLGLAFMFIEIILMTKFILFLGHPSFSLSVVLFTILVFTGAGSYVSSLLKIEEKKLLMLDIALLIVVGIIYYLFLDKLFLEAISLSQGLRSIISFLLLAPVGFCLGVPYPLGLKKLGRDNSTLIPWAWGVNGCASVLGSVMSLVLAQALGFRSALLIALSLYLAAVFVFYLISSDNANQI